MPRHCAHLRVQVESNGKVANCTGPVSKYLVHTTEHEVHVGLLGRHVLKYLQFLERFCWPMEVEKDPRFLESGYGRRWCQLAG